MGGGGSVGSRPLPKCVCVAVLCHELCLFLWLLVRWEQIALCGHATVGAAHALASEGFIPRCQVGVSTGSGVWDVSVLTPFCGQSKVDFISKSGPLATSIEGTPRALAKHAVSVGDSGAHSIVSGEWLTLDFPAEVVAPLPDAEASASSAQLVRPCGWHGDVSPPVPAVVTTVLPGGCSWHRGRVKHHLHRQEPVGSTGEGLAAAATFVAMLTTRFVRPKSDVMSST